jgi:hypothetical protein
MGRPAAELELAYSQAQGEIERLSAQVKRLTNTESELYAFQEALDRQYRIYRRLYEFGQRMVGTLDLGAMQRDAVEFCLYELNFERCLILTLGEDGAVFRPQTWDGYYDDQEPSQLPRQRFPIDDPVVVSGLQTPLICAFPSADRRPADCPREALQAFGEIGRAHV